MKIGDKVVVQDNVKACMSSMAIPLDIEFYIGKTGVIENRHGRYDTYVKKILFSDGRIIYIPENALLTIKQVRSKKIKSLYV